LGAETGGAAENDAPFLGIVMKNYIERSMSFTQYRELIDRLVSEGRTSGLNQSEKMAEYTRLNRQRMHRLEKTIETNEEVRQAVGKNSRRMIWLILTEAWCGDAAQNIPVVEKVAAASDKIETRYILRDENVELMDRFLTNGARAIPKLIAIDGRTFELLGSWGARPAAAQVLFLERKAAGVEKPVIQEELQRWYNADGGQSLQLELKKLIAEWQNAVEARPLAEAALF